MRILSQAGCRRHPPPHRGRPPSTIADWASGCSREIPVVLGGRRDRWTGQVRPPCERTFAAMFKAGVASRDRESRAFFRGLPFAWCGPRRDHRPFPGM